MSFPVMVILSIIQGEVTEVVRQLLMGKVPGVDELRPKYLKCLDVQTVVDVTALEHCFAVWL